MKDFCVQLPRLLSIVDDSFARCCSYCVRGFVFGPCVVM